MEGIFMILGMGKMKLLVELFYVFGIINNKYEREIDSFCRNEIFFVWLVYVIKIRIVKCIYYFIWVFLDFRYFYFLSRSRENVFFFFCF